MGFSLVAKYQIREDIGISPMDLSGGVNGGARDEPILRAPVLPYASDQKSVGMTGFLWV
ncbi:hypothetical protein [Phyllobacterium myrsinacearum]|uniref:Uncharacterized protein n=1 Tax=Phyllobacterium myrsinacearum TaxID=28101 RepID=A0A839EJA5_9HYPH|nr:hypothetical protein [Phyllobacterium myrsinacearum]MBA8877614.1 hypothetical protein [Phyllobacterium myrsinacearum]